MKIFKWMLQIKLTLLLVAVAALGGAAYWFFAIRNKPKIEVSAGKIDRIQTMVRLSSMDIYNEVPVVDTINNKVICAVQKQRGSISFDIERLQVDTVGDTVRIVLPKEIVELYESTEPDAWTVIDTKAVGPMAFLHSGKLSAGEENAIKRRIAAKSRRELYRNGTVKRARTEAAQNLTLFAERIYRRPVVVTIDATHR